MMNRTAVAEAYLRQREALLAEFPELADDVQALADTLEGMSEAPDLIARFVRDAREDEAMTSALADMIKAMGERRTRIAYRAERRRQAAQSLMSSCELRKIEMPDFTASIRTVPPKVEIVDEAALPDTLCRFIRSADKAKIKEALSQGPVEGARMTNGAETIAIKST